MGSLERIKDDVADEVDGNVDVVDGADSNGLHFVASVQPERKETERGPICKELYIPSAGAFVVTTSVS